MKLLAIGGSLLTVVIIALASLGQLPSWLYAVYAFPGGDKAGHVLVFGLLAFTLEGAFGGRDAPWYRRPALLLALMATAEETAQIWEPARTASWLDLGATYLGISIGFIAVRSLFRERAVQAGEGGERSASVAARPTAAPNIT